MVDDNALNGITISGTGASDTLIKGNLIGLGLGGQPLGNRRVRPAHRQWGGRTGPGRQPQPQQRERARPGPDQLDLDCRDPVGEIGQAQEGVGHPCPAEVGLLRIEADGEAPGPWPFTLEKVIIDR